MDFFRLSMFSQVTGPTSIEPERAPKLTHEETAQERPEMLALTAWLFLPA